MKLLHWALLAVLVSVAAGAATLTANRADPRVFVQSLEPDSVKVVRSRSLTLTTYMFSRNQKTLKRAIRDEFESRRGWVPQLKCSMSAPSLGDAGGETTISFDDRFGPLRVQVGQFYWPPADRLRRAFDRLVHGG